MSGVGGWVCEEGAQRTYLYEGGGDFAQADGALPHCQLHVEVLEAGQLPEWVGGWGEVRCGL